MNSRTNQEWHISGITTSNMRHGDSDLLFKTHSNARKFINSKQGKNYAICHNIIEYRITRVIEIIDDDVEIHKVEI